jgi:hypothetical protein
MVALRRSHRPGVVRITTAPESPEQDMAHRQKRYMISMGIRTLCFIGAVLTIRIPWVCWTLIAASFVLPYIAVVMANTASPRVDGTLPPGPSHTQRELDRGPTDGPD